MAEVAQGTTCPYCKTLTACTGSFDSATLVGKCGCCGRTVTMPHHEVVRVWDPNSPFVGVGFRRVPPSSVAVSHAGTVAPSEDDARVEGVVTTGPAVAGAPAEVGATVVAEPEAQPDHRSIAERIRDAVSGS